MIKLVLIPFCISITWAYNVEFDTFTMTTDRRFSDPFDVLQARNELECCSLCSTTDTCQSANYRLSTGSCELTRLPFIAVTMHAAIESGWKAYSKNEWMLVFKGCSSNGHDVLTSYTTGLNAINDDVMCIHGNVSACSQGNQHFRSSSLDSWESLGVTRVKYAMYKNDEEVAYMTFDGTGSDILDWFSLSRLIDTPWTGLWSVNPIYDWFAIEGFRLRRFYINNLFNSCPSDVAFTMAVVGPGGCSYDSQPTYPTYIYATSPLGGRPETMSDMDVADYIAVYIMT